MFHTEIINLKTLHLTASALLLKRLNLPAKKQCCIRPIIMTHLILVKPTSSKKQVNKMGKPITLLLFHTVVSLIARYTVLQFVTYINCL